jgi:RNA polymerase sigma-70 factor (ECF subfamily)
MCGVPVGTAGEAADSAAAFVPGAVPTSRAAAPIGPSFADIVGAHLERLYGYCLRLTGDAGAAEDLVGETLLRATKGYPDLRDPEHVKGWLFVIATNAWRDQGRARARELETARLDDVADDDFSLYQVLAVEDPFPYSDQLHLDFLRLFREEDVQLVLAALHPTFRIPLLLTVVHGFSCREAATILGIPLGTVLSRLHRARKQIERGLWDYAVRNRLVRTTDAEAADEEVTDAEAP